MRILVVDDEPILTRSLVRNLGEHEIVCAADVAEAETALQTNSFDLVLCDLNLPDGSGLDLRRRFASPVALDFVMLTGDVDARDLPGRVLLKPFKLSEVRELIANLDAVGASGALAHS